MFNFKFELFDNQPIHFKANGFYNLIDLSASFSEQIKHSELTNGFVIDARPPYNGNDISIVSLFKTVRKICELTNYSKTIVFIVKSLDASSYCSPFFPLEKRLVSEFQFKRTKIEITTGDITEEKTDAIVNASNPQLKLGGGVSGAIRKKANPVLQEMMFQLATQLEINDTPFEDGKSVLTESCGLPSKYIIHTASVSGTEPVITKCIYSILQICEEMKFNSVSIPALGTGTGGLKIEILCENYKSIFKEYFTEKESSLKTIRLLFYSSEEYEIAVSVFKND